jgi:sugar lactone lactonase YvrE
MNSIRRTVGLAALALALTITPATPSGAAGGTHTEVTRLVTGLGQGAGSTIGPDGALYVTEPLVGKISRIDRRTGKVTTYAEGLPAVVPAVGIGGAMDVIFHHGTAYVLVTLVGEDVGGDDVVGVYRVDRRTHDVSVFADLGAYSIANPPDTDFFVPSGVQYAIENVPGGFLVTDGHHNRVLRITDKGEITQVVAFENRVPTGLEVRGRRVWVAQAGPLPHLPEDGRIVTFGLRDPEPRQVAAGGRLLVDVEFGRHGTLYALAQGVWPLGNPEGSPASPDTGQLLRVDQGGFDVVAKGLDRPTSLEIVGNTAYVVTLDGEVWTVDLSPRHRHR